MKFSINLVHFLFLSSIFVSLLGQFLVDHSLSVTVAISAVWVYYNHNDEEFGLMLNPLVMNRLSHLYHFDEQISI